VLPPEIIEKFKRERREREQQERPAMRIPLSEPEIRPHDQPIEHEEKTDRVIVIDLA
jgi:hypothetical protein